MHNFWNWLENNPNNAPTLGREERISAKVVEDLLFITAGNGTVQPGIRRKTVERYVQEFQANQNDNLTGQKRYVIALFLKFKQDQSD
jgi:hypothetical protein